MVELDTETVRNAADIVNSMLLTRAYIEEELKFNSINWKELTHDQAVGDLVVTESIYNNDKALINIIHSLVSAVDRLRHQHKLSNQTISKKDNTINTLNKRIESLERELASCESKLNQSQNYDQTILTSKINDLTKHNKLQAQDIVKLKNWTNDLGTKYQVETKRKNLEINDLKDKLLDKRNLSSTITYGIPLSESSTPPTNTPASSYIYNNNPIIDNATGYITNTETITSIVNSEYEEVISDMSPIIDSLMAENYKFTRFVELLNTYYTTFNSQLSDLKPKGTSLNLPNPSNIIDLNEISNADTTTIKKYFDEMETFEFVAKPVLNSIYRFYHNINNLIQVIGSTSLTLESDDSKTKQLEKELEIMRKNWQDALKTAENWKNYQQRNSNES